jgi:hypothetical protein
VGIHDTYLVDGTEPSVAELIELGKEIGGGLQSTELEKEVERLGGGSVISFVVVGSAAASKSLLQAGAETGEKPHQVINRRVWPAGIPRRSGFVQLRFYVVWPQQLFRTKCERSLSRVWNVAVMSFVSLIIMP